MKLSLTGKIFLGFASTLITFAVIALFSVNEFHALGEDLRNINDGHLVLARLAGQLETHQQNRFRDLRRVRAEADPDSQQVVLRIATAYFPDVIRSRVDDVRDVCDKQIQNKAIDGAKLGFYRAIHGRIDEIGRRHEVVDELTETMLQRVRSGVSLNDLDGQVERLEGDLRGEVYQLVKIIDDETDRAVRRAERDERNAIWRVVALTIAALLVGLLMTVLAGRSLAPIHQLVEFARAVSRGDYEQQVELRGDDELSALASELKAMARVRKEREEELDRQQDELERAYHRVADLKRYHESVVQSLRTAVIVTDRELTVTSANRAVETSLGLVRDEVRGRRLDTLPIGAKLVDAVGPLADLLESAQTVSISAMVLDDRTVEISVAPFQNDEGAVMGLVLAAEDVTEAVQTKEALIRSERLAAIGRMSAHVTHEIRNPLSSIGLNAELLVDSDPVEARQLCQAIIREVDRLTAITDEYLRFARLPRPELGPSEVRPLLTTIAQFVARDLSAASVEIDVDVGDDVPPVQIDTDQIRQAILNLVRNAKESMPEGGHIQLTARREDDGIAIVVGDTGGGIDTASIERIFDPFYSTKLTGTGLGLALVQQIVTEHGGSLRVESERGSGTEVTLVLPDRQGAKISPLSAAVPTSARASGE